MLHNLCIHFKDNFADIVEIQGFVEEESHVTIGENDTDLGMQTMIITQAPSIRDQIAHSLP